MDRERDATRRLHVYAEVFQLILESCAFVAFPFFKEFSFLFVHSLFLAVRTPTQISDPRKTLRGVFSTAPVVHVLSSIKGLLYYY